MTLRPFWVSARGWRPYSPTIDSRVMSDMTRVVTYVPNLTFLILIH